MSNSNRSAREKLEKIYGKHCMVHEGIRKINSPKPKNVRYKGKCIASQLTYHHLYPKHLGGKATVENGAEICRTCHDWLEQLSKAEREKVNNELRKYKQNFFIRAAEITTEKVVQVVQLEVVDSSEYIEIPAYDFTEEQYQEHLKKRRKQELEKPKWEER